MLEKSAGSAARCIVVVRGKRVILASDLARIYGVETRALNQAVKRNGARFPSDFAFRLTRREAAGIARSRSQNVILKRGENTKYRPLVFTEHGATMAASVLNSARAIQMSVFVVRAFLRLRELANEQMAIATRLWTLEHRIGGHDRDLEELFNVMNRLVAARAEKKRRIGFAVSIVPSRGIGRRGRSVVT